MNQPFFIPIPNPQAKSQVVLFHHAGGNSAQYVRIARAFSKDYEVVLADLPGRGRRSKEPFSNLEQIVSEFCDGLAEFTRLPSIISGHSLGALIAYEVALRLSSAKALVLSSPPVAIGQRISTLEDSALLEKINQWSPMPPELMNPDVIKYLIPVLRADFKLLESNYWSTERFNGPTFLFKGASDLFTSNQMVEQWSSRCDLQLPIGELPGGHFYLLSYPSNFTRCFEDRLRSITA